MLRVGWSCITSTAFFARPLNSDLLQVILGVKSHYSVAIICLADEDIWDVTSLREEIVALFLQS
jgi:hypothetical protein